MTIVRPDCARCFKVVITCNAENASSPNISSAGFKIPVVGSSVLATCRESTEEENAWVCKELDAN
jgi:hypothetical protein